MTDEREDMIARVRAAIAKVLDVPYREVGAYRQIGELSTDALDMFDIYMEVERLRCAPMDESDVNAKSTPAQIADIILSAKDGAA